MTRISRICEICNHTKTEHVPYRKQDSLRDHCKTCHKERNTICQHEFQDRKNEYSDKSIRHFIQVKKQWRDLEK